VQNPAAGAGIISPDRGAQSGMKGLILIYVLCYGGAVVSLFNPFVGLLIYICFAIVKPEFLWHWSVPQGNYSRIVAIALLAGWMFKGFGNWQFGRAKAIVAAFAGYWLWTAITSTWAIDLGVAWQELEALTKILVPFLVGITIIDSVRKLKQLAWVIVLSQGYVAYYLNECYFNGYNLLWEEGFGGMDNNCNAIAFVTCIGLAFFLGLQTEKWSLKALAFVLAGLMGHAILFSFSRGGMLALIVTGFVSFVLLPKRPKDYLMFLVAALVVVRLAGPGVVARFETTFAESGARDGSAQSRLDLWAACWDLMLKHPLGIGPNQFGLVVVDYGFPLGKLAHSVWLQVGAEVGFVGLGCLVLFYAICVARLWSLAREKRATPDPWLPVAARMVIASLVGFVVSAQFVSLKGLEVPYYVVLIGAAVLKLSSAPAGSLPDAASEPSERHCATEKGNASSELECAAV
jgi:probable O-glycosylation ligase (exosortase A-associated)